MPKYYEKYSPFPDMSDDDYRTYKNNKREAEMYGDADGSLNAANQGIRDKYGIKSDVYSFSQLDQMDRVNNVGFNPWDKEAGARYDRLDSYRGYSDPYADDIDASYRALKNFTYDPSNDPTFNAYADMYARQSASAQDKTYSDLSALSGGRNNSWASAATAQVGQAYAQKTAELVPQLAQQAYNKLLQEYDIDVSRSDREYGRMLDRYNIDSNLYNMAMNNANTYRDMAYNQESLDMSLKDAELSFKEKQMRLEALPQELKNSLELSTLSVEQQRIVNKYLDGQLSLENLIRELRAETYRRDLNNYGSGGRVSDYLNGLNDIERTAVYLEMAKDGDYDVANPRYYAKPIYDEDGKVVEEVVQNYGWHQ